MFKVWACYKQNILSPLSPWLITVLISWITFHSILTRALFHCLSFLTPFLPSLSPPWILHLSKIRLSPLFLLKPFLNHDTFKFFPQLSSSSWLLPQIESTGAASTSLLPTHSVIPYAPPLNWIAFLKVNRDLQSDYLFILPNLKERIKTNICKRSSSSFLKLFFLNWNTILS